MTPTPSATPPASHPKPMLVHAYRMPPRKKPSALLSPVTLVLLIAAPAVLAVAVLRPRSSSR
ncbi:hypothetical protein [Streptomyces sp. CBMA152]|uniref:hypothetical protein n=1 Tax=Streptomyces sp. CBMA152 TaxID=1896312 RepID=UPI001660A32E|nr:hypothetical protein [Streptomyces sp. CBMA152]